MWFLMNSLLNMQYCTDFLNSRIDIIQSIFNQGLLDFEEIYAILTHNLTHDLFRLNDKFIK